MQRARSRTAAQARAACERGAWWRAIDVPLDLYREYVLGRAWYSLGVVGSKLRFGPPLHREPSHGKVHQALDRLAVKVGPLHAEC